jgi:hypothetical protein
MLSFIQIWNNIILIHFCIFVGLFFMNSVTCSQKLVIKPPTSAEFTPLLHVTCLNLFLILSPCYHLFLSFYCHCFIYLPSLKLFTYFFIFMCFLLYNIIFFSLLVLRCLSLVSVFFCLISCSFLKFFFNFYVHYLKYRTCISRYIVPNAFLCSNFPSTLFCCVLHCCDVPSTSHRSSGPLCLSSWN